MEGKEIMVSGTYEALIEYVQRSILDEEIKKTIGEDRFQKISEALTDAMIRYTEGIETACKSEDIMIKKETNSVTWVSKKTNKAIAITRVLKEFVRNSIISIPVVIVNYADENSLSIVSTFLQILIYAYINNSRKLKDEEKYLYSLGYNFIKGEGGNYFSIDDIIECDEKTDKRLAGKTKDEIKSVYFALESYGLIDSAGELYKIVF